MDETMKGGMMCKCGHHKALPVLVLLFGLVFLLGALDVLADRAVSILWPILVMLAGLLKLVKCKCC